MSSRWRFFARLLPYSLPYKLLAIVYSRSIHNFLTYQPLYQLGENVDRFKSKGNILPGAFHAYTRLLMSPREVIVMTTVVHSIAGRCVTRSHWLIKFVSVVSYWMWYQKKTLSIDRFSETCYVRLHPPLPPFFFFRCLCQEQFPRGYHYRKGTAWSPRNFIKKFSLIFAVTYRCWLQILQAHLSQRPWVLRRNRQTACTFHVSGRAGREKSFIWVAIKRNIHDECLDLTQLCMETILRNLLLTIIISGWGNPCTCFTKIGHEWRQHKLFMADKPANLTFFSQVSQICKVKEVVHGLVKSRIRCRYLTFSGTRRSSTLRRYLYRNIYLRPPIVIEPAYSISYDFIKLG